MKKIKVICFDADDTLWVNEPFFREAEKEFCKIMHKYSDHHNIMQELLHTEIQNLNLYGYGIKGFTLSLLETANRISNYKINGSVVDKILNIGKSMLNEPVVLLDDVENVLKELQKYYRLIIATKGDLLDQERKLEKSGLLPLFHHIEIMSEKREKDYLKLIKHLDIRPEEFLMIGNSLKSDVIPILNIGGSAVHIPFYTTWIHEQVEDEDIKNPKFHKVDRISHLPNLLK